jgi:hypothetical protein
VSSSSLYNKANATRVVLARSAAPVAVIDGPYDEIALEGILASLPLKLGFAGCPADAACSHGTFVMGLLGARRDALIPGLCPECPLIHVPLFVNEQAQDASVDELANSIALAVAAGAKLINLSLAILRDDTESHLGLAAVLDRAEATGVVVVAAASNVTSGQLLSHPAIIPVVAVDAAGRALLDPSFGPAVSSRGVAALGHNVLGYAVGGGTTVMSGGSVATAIATGILAQVWANNPDRDSRNIRAAIASLVPRCGSIPPLLTVTSLLAALNRPPVEEIAPGSQGGQSGYPKLQGGRVMRNDAVSTSLNSNSGPTVRAANIAARANGAAGCACGAPGICNCGNGETSSSRFVYVLGTVDIRFPDQSIAEELGDVARTSQIAQRANESVRNYYYRVLSQKTEDGRLKARHVARQVCWVLKVEGYIAYYLSLRDLDDLPDLINCLRRPEPGDHPQPEHDESDKENGSMKATAKTHRVRRQRKTDGQRGERDRQENAHPPHQDLDLFIGTSSLIPAEACPGVVAPTLAIDQLSSFKKKELVSWCDVEPPHNPENLFRKLVQSADNLGDNDEWRALNFLAVRYKPIYEKYAEMVTSGYILDSIKVVPSRLSRDKHIVDPVFAFVNNDTAVIAKAFVRVDVSHLYPIIVNHLAEYFDR